MTNRRTFIQQTATLAALLASTPGLSGFTSEGPKTILPRSSWQTVNTGDIGHTP